MEYQVVEVLISMAGDYCAFHECDLSLEYDFTNNISFGDMNLEEAEQKADEDYDGEYVDYQVVDGVKIGDKYYIEIF